MPAVGWLHVPCVSCGCIALVLIVVHLSGVPSCNQLRLGTGFFERRTRERVGPTGPVHARPLGRARTVQQLHLAARARRLRVRAGRGPRDPLSVQCARDLQTLASRTRHLRFAGDSNYYIIVSNIPVCSKAGQYAFSQLACSFQKIIFILNDFETTLLNNIIKLKEI